MIRLALAPKRLSRDLRYRPLADGYGARKRRRLVARAPLLAQLPGYVPSVGELEERMVANNAAWIAARRRQVAADWLRVLRWRRQASVYARAAFALQWQILPHSPEYALDLIYRITGRRAE